MKKFLRIASVFFSLHPAAYAAQNPIGWPEVIDRLTQEKQQAITCVSLLKASGHADGVKESYELARGDVDGVIAGLEITLVDGGKPGTLPTIQQSLENAGKSLESICDAAVRTLPPHAKGVWDEIAKATVEPLIKAISEGIGVLWTWKVDNDKLALDTKRSKLEAAKWPEFVDISAQ